MKVNSDLLERRTVSYVLIALAMGAAFSVVASGQDGPALGEEKPHKAHMVVKKSPVKDADGNMVPGIEVAHDFERRDTDDKLDPSLYNPYFDGTIRPTGVAVWVFDRQGNYVGNLLATSPRNVRLPRVEDFVPLNFIPSNPRLGRRMAIPTGGRVSDDGVILFPALKPGKYRIQAVGFARMRSTSPVHSKATDEDVALWLRKYSDSKVEWRSNVLEIEIAAAE